MAAKRSRLYELWNVNENELFNSKKESIILRISPNSYMRKASARGIKPNEQLVKLELGYDSRVSKALNVYMPPDSEIYQRLESIFDDIASMHMIEVEAVAVTQAKR